MTEQLEVVGQLTREFGQRFYDAVELLLFAAQFLGLLRVVPDLRVFQRCVDRSQALRFGIEVKDTPGGLGYGRKGRRACCRSG